MGPSLVQWILSLETGSRNGDKVHHLAWTATSASSSSLAGAN